MIETNNCLISLLMMLLNCFQKAKIKYAPLNPSASFRVNPHITVFFERIRVSGARFQEIRIKRSCMVNTSVIIYVH